MLEHRGAQRRGENEIFAHRKNERLAPVLHGADFDGIGEQRARVGEPGRAGHDDAGAGAQTVATVIEHHGRTARQGHLVAQDDDRTRGERRRIIGVAGRFAVGIVAIAPDLRVGLHRITEIDFVAILPMIHHDLRPRHRHRDGDDGLGDGAQARGQHGIILTKLILRLRHIPFLRDGQCAGQHSRGQQRCCRSRDQCQASAARDAGDLAVGSGHDEEKKFGKFSVGKAGARGRAHASQGYFGRP